MINRLWLLYRKTGGGHKMLSAEDLAEYASLRKAEFQAARLDLTVEGATDIHPVKDTNGDIVGWHYIGRRIMDR